MDVNNSKSPATNMDVNNWRDQMPAAFREKIINKIMEKLVRQFEYLKSKPPADMQGIALKFEGKIFSQAQSQEEYMLKISSKLLTLDKMLAQNVAANSLPPVPPVVAENSADQASHGSKPQEYFMQGQSALNFVTNQSQVSQCMLARNTPENNIYSSPNSNVPQQNMHQPQKSHQQQVLLKAHHSGLQARQLSQQSNQKVPHIPQQQEMARQGQPEQTKSSSLPTRKQSGPQNQHEMRSEIPLQQTQSYMFEKGTGRMIKTAVSLSQQQQLLHTGSSFPAESSMKLDLTSKIAQESEVGSLEEVYKKLKKLSDMFEPELKRIFQRLHMKYKQIVPIDQQSHKPPTDEQKGLCKVLNLTKRILQVLNVPKDKLPADIEVNIGTYERYIKAIIDKYGTETSNSSKPEGQHPQLEGQTVQQQGNGVNTISQYRASTCPPQSNSSLLLQRRQYSGLMPSNSDMPQSTQVKQQQQKMKQKMVQQKRQIEGKFFHWPTADLAHGIPKALKLNTGLEMGDNRGILEKNEFAEDNLVISHQLVMQEYPANTCSPQFIQVESSQHSSRQVAQQHFQANDAAGASFQSPSPSSLTSTPLTTTSSITVDPDNLSFDAALNSGFQQISASAVETVTWPTPLIVSDDLEGNDDYNLEELLESTIPDSPFERLINAARGRVPGSSIDGMVSVVNLVDRMAGAGPGNGSRAPIGENLMETTYLSNYIKPGKFSERRNFWCYPSPMSSNIVSSSGGIDGSYKELTEAEIFGDFEFTPTSSSKRPKLEAYQFLLEEVTEINQRFIDTEVDVSDGGVDSMPDFSHEGGIIVKCSFTAVSISADLKQHLTGLLPVPPLRLFVPTNYPDSSPILLDNLSAETRDAEDFFVKARLKLDRVLRSLEQPMSVKEIAKVWATCVHEVIREYAEQFGGGSFSSRYGTWRSFPAGSA